MDRLDNPSKIKAFELSEELKGIMSPLYAKHQDDIISGAFSRGMMADWDNDDANLLKWRAATAETGFEKTPALTMATINTPLSKYSCSEMSCEPAGVFSKPVSAVAARHLSKLASSLSQSAIIPRENAPLMMSSWCFAYNGLMMPLSSSLSSNALIFDGLSRR